MAAALHPIAVKGEVNSMQGSTIKKALLAMVLASALPLAACGDDNGTPTSPTQPGPPVSQPAPPAPEPTPTPTPAPPTTDDGTPITVKGVVSRMSRSGADGIDVVFRVGDEVFMRGDANTTVLIGSTISNTTALREGQIVTVDARQRADHVYAKHVVVD